MKSGDHRVEVGATADFSTGALGPEALGLFHLLINGIYWGCDPLILTFDPNFLGHPSTSYQHLNTPNPSPCRELYCLRRDSRVAWDICVGMIRGEF